MLHLYLAKLCIVNILRAMAGQKYKVYIYIY